MMITLITGSLVLSILHAMIPNHWLPVLAISRKENWTIKETTSVTFLSGASHAIGTVLIGVVIAIVGVELSGRMEVFAHVVAPIILIGLGIFYIYQHHRHKHFHLHGTGEQLSKSKVVLSLVVAMFFSPCFEIEAYFLVAGAHGWKPVAILAGLYTVVTVGGMVIWIRLAYRGLYKFNWHALEHNAGIITGATLITTGFASFFIH